MFCIRDWTTSQYGSRGRRGFVLFAIDPPLLFSSLRAQIRWPSVTLGSRGIRFETGFHRAFNGAIDVFSPWKKPFFLIILLIAVFVDGERPLLHIPCVFQPTNGRETSIIPPIQIEKLALIARDIYAMGVTYGCGIEVFHNSCNVRLDLVDRKSVV